ncbi:MAG: DNA-binding protein [Prevotella sp.]|nr:DNA-binding protein [Prevotella sp.]
MAIKVRANERLLKFDKDSAGEYRYCLAASIYNTLSASKVIKEAALRSGISKGVMTACWDAAAEVIKAWATEGHSVSIPGLGKMRFGLRADSVDDVNKVSTDLITSRRVIFTPSTDIKDELASTAIQITCYDRNGNEVKRVTSSDAGEVEDPEGEENTNSGTNGSSGNENGSTGDNQGGGSDDPGENGDMN